MNRKSERIAAAQEADDMNAGEPSSKRRKKAEEEEDPSQLPSDLNLEDTRYLLKALESLSEEDAYSSVVSALRAQGPLSEYKRALLDHLKAALFIPTERQKAEIRRAANDDILLAISKKMNPMCDPYHDWSLEGSPLGRLYPTQGMVSSGMSSLGQDAARRLADQLALKAEEHNDRLSDGEQALLNLIQLPKKPQVPETLKYLLHQGSEVVKKPEKPLPEMVPKATSPIKVDKSPAKKPRKRPPPPVDRLSTGTSVGKSSGQTFRKQIETETTTSNSALSTPEPINFPQHPNSYSPEQQGVAPSGSSTAAEIVAAVAARPSHYPVPSLSPIKNGPSLTQLGPSPTNTPTSPGYTSMVVPADYTGSIPRGGGVGARAKAVKKVSSANPNIKIAAAVTSPSKRGAPAMGGRGAGRAASLTFSMHPGARKYTSVAQMKEELSSPSAGPQAAFTTSVSPTAAVGSAKPAPSIAAGRGEPVMRCARVEPFIFPLAPQGSTQKPPRGNPDKRVKKHPNIVPGLMRTAGRSVGSLGSIGSNSSLKRRKPPLFYDEISVPDGSDPGSTNVDDYIYSCLPHRRERRPVHSEYYGSYYGGSGPSLGRPTGAALLRGSPATPRYNAPSTAYHSSYFRMGPPAQLTAPGVAPTAAVQAAYSSPTRPYYGNPSAAALGITVRPTGEGGRPVVTAQQQGNSSTAGSTPTTQEKVYVMRQSGNPPGTPETATYISPAEQRYTATPSLIAPKPSSQHTQQQVILTTSGGASHGVSNSSTGQPINGNGAPGTGNVVIVRRVTGDRPIISTATTLPIASNSNNLVLRPTIAPAPSPSFHSVLLQPPSSQLPSTSSLSDQQASGAGTFVGSSSELGDFGNNLVQLQSGDIPSVAAFDAVFTEQSDGELQDCAGSSVAFSGESAELLSTTPSANDQE